MTTQDQANGPAYDEGFCDISHGSNRAGMFATATKGNASNRVSTETATHKPVEIELVDSPRQMIVSCWRKESDGRMHSLLKSKAIRGSGCNATNPRSPQCKSQRGRGYCETGCEILKQVADRFHYRRRPWERAVCSLFLSGICRHRKHMSIGLSGREAKFFLDRGKQSPYYSHKFFGAFPARAKYHLHAKGKVVNCCSHFLGGASEPLAGHDGTRFRKAETGRPNQASESIPRLRSLREDRPVGVISIPSAHGRRQY